MSIQETVERCRAYFSTGATIPVEARIEALRALERSIGDNIIISEIDRLSGPLNLADKRKQLVFGHGEVDIHLGVVRHGGERRSRRRRPEIHAGADGGIRYRCGRPEHAARVRAD